MVADCARSISGSARRKGNCSANHRNFARNGGARHSSLRNGRDIDAVALLARQEFMFEDQF
jgi:hypothetical protein